MWMNTLVVAAVLLVGFGIYQIAKGNAVGGGAMIAIAVGNVALVAALRRRRQGR